MEDAKGTTLMVFDLAAPSDIPSIIEPLFATLHAAITLTPVMDGDDMRKALQKLAS